MASGGFRHPPPRVMEERAQRDAAVVAKKYDASIKRLADATYDNAKNSQQSTAAKFFEAEERRRKSVTVDQGALTALRQISGQGNTVSFEPIQDWKSPVKTMHKSAPHGLSLSDPVDEASTKAFMKLVGVWDHNKNPLHSSHHLPERSVSLTPPRDRSPSRSQQPFATAEKTAVKPPAAGSSASPPPHPATTQKISAQNQIDHTRAPSRTLVNHCHTIRNLMRTKPLAPIPAQPRLVDTTCPEKGTEVNTDALLSKFKMTLVEERDYGLDVRSREIAEDQDGTLLHFEMTKSIKRVENILSALERGKEYRDLVAYKDAHDAKEKDDAKQTVHDETSIEELRQVIQILLRDSAKQATLYQDLEIHSRKTTNELRDAQDELIKKNALVVQLQQQLDNLIGERETIKKDKLHLELQIERLSESTKQMSELITMSRTSDRETKSLDSSTNGTPTTVSVLPPVRETKRQLDASTMLRELAPALPSIDAIPRGNNVTIVCTAVQAIGQLWDRCPEDMPTAISLHNRIILEEIPKHRGYQVKTAGEEFMVAFHSTTQALNFAMAVHETMVQQMWPQRLASFPFSSTVAKHDDSSSTNVSIVVEDCSGVDTTTSPHGEDLWRGLRVAIGIHCGPVHVDFNPVTNGYDYMGSTVNRALLLKRVSHGGMAAVSKEVYERINAEVDLVEDVTQQKKSISYAETLRRRSSARSLLPAVNAANRDAEGGVTLCPVTTAFHCKVPAARSAPIDVYCVVPQSLEDRLADIQAANKAMAEAHGINLDDVLQPATEEEQPSELETMLGAFSQKKHAKALFLTGDGVADANSMLTDEEEAQVALQHADLPTGQVTLLCIQCESMRNKRFTEKVLTKDMDVLLDKYRESIELASAPFGARLVDHRRDTFTFAFGSIGVAVRCALAIDAELTTQHWPKMIDNFKDTEEVRWHKNVRIFAGLRAAMGIHSAHMTPHYDPMTQTVGYIGLDAFVASRLASFAKAGQILVEETVAYQALGTVRPMPLYVHISGSSPGTVASRLCVISARAYVGRHFFWAGMERYEQCKLPTFHSQYTRMQLDLETEDLRWRRDATRVVAKEHLNSGITTVATTKSNDDGDGDANKHAEEGGQKGEEDGTGTLMGLGEQFEAVVQKTAGTITHAMEIRQRDCEVLHIFILTFLEKLAADGLSEVLRDRDPMVGQLEKLEHNLMVLHDTFYEGQLVAFQPLIADMADVRELPLKGTSRDAPALGGDAPNTARKRSVTENEWTDADDDDADEKLVEDDDDVDALATLAAANNAYGKMGEGKTAAEEELKKRLVVLEEEVLLSHRILRLMFTVLKEWMEPLISTNTRYVMPDDEVVSKLIAADRATREPYLKKTTAPTTGAQAVAASVPKTTRQLWRQIVEHTIADPDLEERMRGKGSKLLKSMESMVCRHFLFLRQYVKRIRMKERGTTHGR